MDARPNTAACVVVVMVHRFKRMGLGSVVRPALEAFDEGFTVLVLFLVGEDLFYLVSGEALGFGFYFFDAQVVVVV